MSSWKTNCEEHGCFRDRHVVDFSPFNGILPRGINFGDVDGIVEYMGEFLLMEWKGEQALWDSIDGGGQDLLHERLAQAGPFTVLQIVGHAGKCEPTMVRAWLPSSTCRTQWKNCNQASLKEQIGNWRNAVERRNALNNHTGERSYG